MTEPTEPSPELAAYRQICKAPAHIHDLVLNILLTPPPHQHGMPAEQLAAQRRTLARDYADRIWAEAAHAGAKWAMARQPTRMVIEPEQYELLVKGQRITTLTDAIVLEENRE